MAIRKDLQDIASEVQGHAQQKVGNALGSLQDDASARLQQMGQNARDAIEQGNTRGLASKVKQDARTNVAALQRVGLAHSRQVADDMKQVSKAAVEKKALSKLPDKYKVAYQSVKDRLRAIDEEVDAMPMVLHPPKMPDFPYLMFSLAAAKDLLDWVDVSGLMILLTTLFSIVMWVVLVMWMFNKMSFFERQLMKWMVRIVVGFIIELIPVAKAFFPTYIILVLMAHYHQTKIVKKILIVAEVLHDAKASSEEIAAIARKALNK